jgi:hypothetical protein
MHNIEKSGFHKGQYVGHGMHTVWKISKAPGGWKAVDQNPDHPNMRLVTRRAKTLDEISKLIETSYLVIRAQAAKARANSIKPSHKRTLVAPSQRTKKKPSKRLIPAKGGHVARRKKDTVPGYYPNPIFADYGPGYAVEHMTGIHPTTGKRAPKLTMGLKYRVERNDKKAGWLTVATFNVLQYAKEYAVAFANAHAATVRVMD